MLPCPVPRHWGSLERWDFHFHTRDVSGEGLLFVRYGPLEKVWAAMFQISSIFSKPYLAIQSEMEKSTTSSIESISWSFAFVVHPRFRSHYGSLFVSARKLVSVCHNSLFSRA